ncbi:MAG: porphobilinogen synthase [Desulfohalobiaceae bacterium]
MSSGAEFFRGRRLRRTPGLRELVRETCLQPRDLVQPYFVLQAEDQSLVQPISSMPGQKQLGLQALLRRVDNAVQNGLRSLILFGIPSQKDQEASQAYAEQGIVQQAVRALKKEFPGLTVITDVCLCEYTSHGHCGIVDQGRVLNDPSLELLAKTAVSHAQAGSDMVAPSDMMDGRVQRIRHSLDTAGYQDLPVMSYAAKYASVFYGPFREAAQSAPSFGDRKTYQMDPANARQAIVEAEADLEQGADILMVKPALPYLDVLQRLRQRCNVPLAAYQVSGEYSMIKAAGEKNWIDEDQVVLESLLAIKRAGADIVLSYFTEQVLELLQEL